MIYICEDFLSRDQCNQLIKLYKNNLNHTYQYRDTFPLNCLSIKNELLDLINLNVNNICEKLFFKEKIRIDNCEIVKWPKGSYQDPHYDGDDVCAVIIYLNDNFIGGKTCFKFEDILKVKPETGKCVIFSNSKYLHWVESVKDNTRYTLAYWYAKS